MEKETGLWGDNNCQIPMHFLCRRSCSEGIELPQSDTEKDKPLGYFDDDSAKSAPQNAVIAMLAMVSGALFITVGAYLRELSLRKAAKAKLAINAGSEPLDISL